MPYMKITDIPVYALLRQATIMHKSSWNTPRKRPVSIEQSVALSRVCVCRGFLDIKQQWTENTVEWKIVWANKLQNTLSLEQHSS